MSSLLLVCTIVLLFYKVWQPKENVLFNCKQIKLMLLTNWMKQSSGKLLAEEGYVHSIWLYIIIIIFTLNKLLCVFFLLRNSPFSIVIQLSRYLVIHRVRSQLIRMVGVLLVFTWRLNVYFFNWYKQNLFINAISIKLEYT